MTRTSLIVTFALLLWLAPALAWAGTYKTGTAHADSINATYLDAGSVDINTGTATELFIRQTVLTGQERTVIDWPFVVADSLGCTSCVIDSARLVIAQSNTKTGFPMSTYRLTAAWVETEATWDSLSAVAAWTTPGGDFAAAPIDTVTPSGTVNESTTFDVTSIVDAWVNGGQTQYGILVKLNPENYTNALPQERFYSDDFGTATLRPYLIVYYSETPSTSIRMGYGDGDGVRVSGGVAVGH